MGTITSDFTRYMVWKSENGEHPGTSDVNYFSVLLNGVFPKERLLDIIQNFILFKDSDGKTIKVLEIRFLLFLYNPKYSKINLSLILLYFLNQLYL